MGTTHYSEITGRIRILATPPSDPVIGDMFYDEDNNSLFRWTGNTWIGFHFTGGGVLPFNNEASATPGTHFSGLASAIRDQADDPTSPRPGDWYYDTDNDNLKIYVNGAWFSAAFSTTTSTSTSTTTTSTSTASSSTSTTTSSSTSTSTTTSTTTTL